MAKRILLLNPPIYDFTGYDFWLKPLGLLSIAGLLRGRADLTLFDYLDRLAPSAGDCKSDEFSRGKFQSIRIDKPEVFANIPRYYYRFGTARSVFQKFLAANADFDFVLIQTVMTYWYLGLQEVIADIRKLSPRSKIVIGGPYAFICKPHAKSMGADMVIQGTDLRRLWRLLDIIPQRYQSPFWEGYDNLQSAAIKITRGCPFECTYCSVPRLYPEFVPRSPLNCGADIDLLSEMGVRDIAFYDDSLLYHPKRSFIPFLQYIIQKQIKMNFHTPNALHCHFITAELAELMVQVGFKTFYLGFESSSDKFQSQTGGKVSSKDLTEAVGHLLSAGAQAKNITAYHLLGHPQTDIQQLEESMAFANSLGIRVMLSDFSPIPGTPDGDCCRELVDLSEPLTHNKTSFPIVLLGCDEINRLKNLCRDLNDRLEFSAEENSRQVFQ